MVARPSLEETVGRRCWKQSNQEPASRQGGLWLVHYLCGWDEFLPLVPGVAGLGLPVALSCTVVALITYIVVAFSAPHNRRPDSGDLLKEAG